MKIETWVCDVEECGNKLEQLCKGKGVKMQVLFTCEMVMNETSDPYLEIQTLDICPNCNTGIIESGRFLRCHRAQGVRTYSIQPGTDGE